MKKVLLIAIAACLLPCATLSAQESGKCDKTKKVYLPEAGDWSIGFDAVPVLKYVGNLFNGTSGNSLESLGGQPITNHLEGYEKGDIAPDVSITGKYMLTNEWAIRANVGFMVRTTLDNAYVTDDKAAALDPLSDAKVIDQCKTSKNGASLMLGAEYRKGKKRVQGVFGMGALFGVKQQKTVYSYGNALTALNQLPSQAWNQGDAYRIDSQKGASDVFVGLTGSAGVEWFVAPKISLGAEVNLSLYYVFGGQTWTTSTGYNSVLNKVEQKTDIVSPGSDYFGFGTDNIGGSLYVSFYF